MNETRQPLAFSQTDLMALADHILALNPDPAPRYRLLRDVLGCPPGDATLQEARRALAGSHWVRELAAAQLPDGTWGRFHSQDARVKGPFPTSEYAIRRALALGLERDHPILQKATQFIAAHLRGETDWCDPPEKHDHPGLWAVNIRTVSGGMLALIDPAHPLLDPLWERWAEIVAAAFAKGSYDPAAELARHQALTGIPSRRLFKFHPYYPLLILSATRRRLPPGLETRMLDFLFHKPDGIYYVYEKPLDAFPRLGEPGFVHWLQAQQVLARFTGWKAFAPAVLNWIWGQRGPDGLWDLGQASGRLYAFPLSESWRRTGSRKVDSSVWVLQLCQSFFEDDPA